MSQHLRIALAFPGCHRRGGVERILLECARELAARGHDVTVFAHEWDQEVESENDIRLCFVPARQHPNFLYGKAFFQACSHQLQNQQFDALSTFGCVSPLGGVPWVQSVHAAWLDRSQKLRPRFSWARLRQRINPIHPILLRLEQRHFGERNYRKVIALTPEVRDDLKHHYGVPDEDIVLIPNGFAPDEFNTKRSADLRDSMRRKLGYTEKDKVIVFVANEAERKGLEPLLHAIANLKDNNIHLLAVGRLPAATWLPIAQKIGLGGRVQFPGPSSNVAQYYAAADLFALPTQYEPWGLVIVEAMACGLPVLTSHCAGAAVAVREGETGELLDDPRSVDEIQAKLQKLLQNEYLNAQEIADSVQEYTWPRVLDRYEEVLIATATPQKN